MTSMKAKLLPALLLAALPLVIGGCTREYTNVSTTQSDGILRPGGTTPGGGAAPSGGGVPWPDPIANPDAPKQSNGGSGSGSTDLASANRR